MKVEINKPKKPTNTKPFPKLMIARNGDIVLFSTKEKGTVISSKFHTIGNNDSGWAPEAFTDFEGSITLSND